MLITNTEADNRLLSNDNLLNKLTRLGKIKPAEVVKEKPRSFEEVAGSVSNPADGRKNLKNSELDKASEEVLEQNNSNLFKTTHPDRMIPMKLKTTAAILGRLGENPVELGKQFGMTPRHVNYLKQGQIFLPEELIEQKLNQVQDQAIDRLLKTLVSMNDDKIANASPKDQSIIARNLAPIARFEKDKSQAATNSQVVVYAPVTKTENHYSTIEV